MSQPNLKPFRRACHKKRNFLKLLHSIAVLQYWDQRLISNKISNIWQIQFWIFWLSFCHYLSLISQTVNHFLSSSYDNFLPVRSQYNYLMQASRKKEYFFFLIFFFQFPLFLCQIYFYLLEIKFIKVCISGLKKSIISEFEKHI